MASIAGVFETLVEVDQKYVKVVDKECDSVSSDLKKWFKKLAVRPPPLNLQTPRFLISFMV